MNTNSDATSITQRLARAKVEDFNDAQAEAFADRMIETLNSAALALMISVGHRAKLFDVMARIDPATSEQEAGIREYTRALMIKDLDAAIDAAAQFGFRVPLIELTKKTDMAVVGLADTMGETA